MPICMYPATVAPNRLRPDNDLQGHPDSLNGIQQGSVVVPGEVIFSSVANLITGHGTYRTGTTIHKHMQHASEDGSSIISPEDRQVDRTQPSQICASLTGRVRIVNKLVYVEPPKARYFGNVGDTIVGRIVEVEQRKWRVDVNSILLGSLALPNVKLPGGELRRKSEDDERAMRSFMKEGDLIVAEVHEVYKDGSLQLHMPGTRTGKLGGGCLLRIPPSLIKRQKIHRHRLAVPRTDSVQGFTNAISSSSSDVISVGLILGCNGYVWIGPARSMDIGSGLAAPTNAETSISNQPELLAERIAVCRVRNCILALTRHGMPIWETSVLAACEASWLADQEQLDEDQFVTEMEADNDQSPPTNAVYNRIARLLHPDISNHLISLVQAKLRSNY